MSLLSDSDFLIHSLRLQYLRTVEDPFGSRLITAEPSFAANRYTIAASLADTERWPELLESPSPPISDTEDGPSGHLGATGLRYTQTIMGGRTGGLGLRTSAKRASNSKRMSNTPRTSEAVALDNEGAMMSQPAAHNSSKFTAAGNQSGRLPTYVPKFKGAAEMEARRNQRMLARRRGPNAMMKSPSASNPPPALKWSSSEDESDRSKLPGQIIGDDDVEDVDAADSFDPEISTSRVTGSHSDSPFSEALSGSASGPESPTSPDFDLLEPRLSPIRETRPRQRPSRNRQHQHPDARGSDATVGIALSAITETAPPPDEIMFPRREIPKPLSHKSMLTAALKASESRSQNPFAEIYASVSGRAEVENMRQKVLVFFPHSKHPEGMEIEVRRDSTVEEVIGFSLLSFWEKEWEPRLNLNLEADEQLREVKLSPVGWIMRIAESDGEVDEDFPPPDRAGKISKFNFDAYAILEASPSQIQQNKIAESKIVRRQIPRRAQTDTSVSQTTGTLAVPSIQASVSGTTPQLSSSLGPSRAYGPAIYLRVRFEESENVVHVSTTIPVSAGMYMQEALELVCRKRKLDWRDYALIVTVGESKILIPLDRTVASLQGKRDLIIVQRSRLPQLGVEKENLSGRTTDPNASIFKRVSDVPEAKFSTTMDITAAYKKYTIYRKLPMLVARQERSLTIDGDSIHIMPPTHKSKAVFESAKTTTFNVTSVTSCHQPSKGSSFFRIAVQLADKSKRYDLEAETPELAAEIVTNVRQLRQRLEKQQWGATRSMRRSRQAT